MSEIYQYQKSIFEKLLAPIQRYQQAELNLFILETKRPIPQDYQLRKTLYNDLEKRYRCNNPECNKKYTGLTGTIYEGTKLPLTIWYSIEFGLNKMPPLSGLKLAQILNVSRKSIWAIIDKIKKNPYKSLIMEDYLNPINF